MLRVLVIGFLLCSPLLAADPGDDSTLVLETLRVEIVVNGDSADITTRATVHNPGEAASFTLTLPDTAGRNLTINGESGAELNLAADQRAELSWQSTRAATLLPHLHPLGTRRLTVPLSHMKGYASLPATVQITLSHPDLPAELFSPATDQPVDGRVADVQLDWRASTHADKLAELLKRLAGFDERQRTHLNRSYTATLVHLADIYTLAQDHTAMAEVCEKLAALEVEGQAAITHCGPWANWRRHVPWQLRRLAAVQAAGLDAAPAAAAARDAMAAIWKARGAAHDMARPFDYFDAVKFGNYWDYDWDQTRALYAQALEVLGDDAAAAAVREAE
jgi:hypothetical protein